MTLTRRQFLIGEGAAAAWAGAGGVVLADRLGAFDDPPPFDRGVFPKPGSSAVAVLRAETYDGDLEGLLVERGSLLSHSAIVAREMGIPAVVALAGVTRWLKDGDWVELDGRTGVVTRVPATANGAAHGQ